MPADAGREAPPPNLADIPPAPHFAVIEKDRTAPIYYAPSRFYGIAEIMKQEASAPNIADIPLPRSFVVIAKDRTAPIYYAPPLLHDTADNVRPPNIAGMLLPRKTAE